MSVVARQVKNKKGTNGENTGRAGTVYDVFITYKTPDGHKGYGKRGFLTKKEALAHEAEMRVKLATPGFAPTKAADEKKTVGEYLNEWVEVHGKANLRPSTYNGYKYNISKNIIPYIGQVPLKRVTPAMIDDLLAKLYDRGLSTSTCRYAHRVLSVAFEAARKYRYIESNPARDILTKFGKDAKTPDPYTIKQVQYLIALGAGNKWEMIFVLSCLYGLRRSEVLGLRWDNVDLSKKQFAVIEQLPFKLPPKTNLVTEMAPTKSQGRILPITDATMPFFIKQYELQKRQRELAECSGQTYYENRLVVCKADGSPVSPDRVTSMFAQFLRHNEMPHIRFHDLRHTAATNMHELTGDFYTVGEVLGHTLKGVGLSLGISTNMADVTARYVDVRLERKQIVLEAYHNAVFPERMKERRVESKSAAKVRERER
ncbi:MAG: tyrosine-type recombinase/integrase [Oscillospiraceae bacterium]|nr:tyrosine-type recombinase/integrase [Oscillospiraceae bacterium]